MITKAQAIHLIQSLDDDVSLDEVIARLQLLRNVEQGLAEADAGDVIEHEVFVEELRAEDGQ
ncbi:MAG: hypothetical protein WDZ51_18950 [Pirellulaceae bacterium]